MRKFNDIEYNTIKELKWRCAFNGEKFSLSRSRYTKELVGHLPGTWMKDDDSIRFEMEISPNERPETLDFRVSGIVPSFVDGKPVCEYRDILAKTIEWSRERFCVKDTPVTPEAELGMVIKRFFVLVENIVSGYTYLLLAMKQGYRFTGGMCTDSLAAAYCEARPEDFMK